MPHDSSPLAGLVARLTDPHDRETYAELVSYFDSLPAEDEMFQLARLLGLLTLIGQRIPEAAAALTTELQAQAKAASACYELFNNRLTWLAAEITEGVDTSAIAQAMAETARQTAGKELADVRILAGEAAEDLRKLSRTARAAVVETATERAKLLHVILDLKVISETVVKRSRQHETVIRWLVFLSGFLSGVLVLISYVQFAW
jgi:hypothetical protein